MMKLHNVMMILHNVMMIVHNTKDVNSVNKLQIFFKSFCKPNFWVASLYRMKVEAVLPLKLLLLRELCL